MVSTTTSATSATGSTAAGTSATASSNTNAIFSNYTAFLTLLTTQLQHQDPLNPTDTSQYTQQLVEYASVEQEMKQNSTLSTINTNLTSNSAIDALSYVGKTVMAQGNSTSLSNGAAYFGYNLPSASSTTTLTVQDSSGNTVYTTSGETASGTHQFTWNGTESDGSTAPDGTYTLSVTAADSSGSAITATTYAQGTVTGVDSSSGTPELVIGSGLVPMNEVVYVGQQSSSSSNSAAAS